jgi:hypothetical protein
MRKQQLLIWTLLAVFGIGAIYYFYEHQYDAELRAVGALYVDRQLEAKGVPEQVRADIFHQACCDVPQPRTHQFQGKTCFVYHTEHSDWYGCRTPEFDLLPHTGTKMYWAESQEDKDRPFYAVRVKDHTYDVVSIYHH